MILPSGGIHVCPFPRENYSLCVHCKTVPSHLNLVKILYRGCQYHSPLHMLVLVEGLEYAKKVFPGTEGIVPGAFCISYGTNHTSTHVFPLFYAG